jgi:hypothetical protein
LFYCRSRVPARCRSYLYSGGLLPDATKTANGVKGLIG